MTIEVGMHPHKLKLEKTAALGPGGDRWVWVLTISFLDKQVVKWYSTEKEANDHMQFAIELLNHSRVACERDQFERNIVRTAIAFFVGGAVGVCLVSLAMKVFA